MRQTGRRVSKQWFEMRVAMRCRRRHTTQGGLSGLRVVSRTEMSDWSSSGPSSGKSYWLSCSAMAQAGELEQQFVVINGLGRSCGVGKKQKSGIWPRAASLVGGPLGERASWGAAREVHWLWCRFGASRSTSVLTYWYLTGPLELPAQLDQPYLGNFCGPLSTLCVQGAAKRLDIGEYYQSGCYSWALAELAGIVCQEMHWFFFFFFQFLAKGWISSREHSAVIHMFAYMAAYNSYYSAHNTALLEWV